MLNELSWDSSHALSNQGRDVDRQANSVFGEWQKATQDDVKAQLERKLIDLLSKHAHAVVWQQLRQHREDIVQDALIRCFQHASKFRGEALFSTWFHRIVLNCCKTVQRKEGHNREVELEEADAVAAPDALGDRELFDSIGGLLDPDDWDFAYQKLNGFDDEIEENFNLSPAGVRVRWHRIRRKLQNMLRST